MGVMTTLGFVRDLLDGQNIPGPAGRMEAFIAPPDPETDNNNPHAYVWLARGSGRRKSGPRSPAPANLTQNVPSSPAGWKIHTHNIGIWLTWFDENLSGGQADSTFPTVLDWTIMMLETCHMPFSTTDPMTGLQCQLINLGQNFDYEYVPVRSTASQRYQRQDAMISTPTEEWVQR
jgi:hypothetical protein